LIAPEIMAGIYRATLRKIARRQYHVFRGRVSLSTMHKVLIALGIFVKIWITNAFVSRRKSALPGA
jgi:phytoene/squalene synthetase